MMTLDQCDSQFDAIRLATFEEEITDRLRVLFTAYPLLEFEIGHTNTFWRGRRCDSRGYSNLSSLSYPPPAITNAGRLNDAGSPCLYAATKVETVLAELNAQENEYVHLIGFRLRPATTIRVMALGELFHVHKTGYMRTFGIDPGGAVGKAVNGYGLDGGKTVVYIDAFFASVLADPDARNSGYLKTRRLAALAYASSKAKSEALFYPSVVDTVGMNFAMLPPAFDAKGRTVCSQVVQVKKRHRFGFFKYEFCLIATGMTAAGDFVWQTPQSQERMVCFNLTVEEAKSAGGVAM